MAESSLYDSLDLDSLVHRGRSNIDQRRRLIRTLLGGYVVAYVVLLVGAIVGPGGGIYGLVLVDLFIFTPLLVTSALGLNHLIEAKARATLLIDHLETVLDSEPLPLSADYGPRLRVTVMIGLAVGAIVVSGVVGYFLGLPVPIIALFQIPVVLQALAVWNSNLIPLLQDARGRDQGARLLDVTTRAILLPLPPFLVALVVGVFITDMPIVLLAIFILPLYGVYYWRNLPRRMIEAGDYEEALEAITQRKRVFGEDHILNAWRLEALSELGDFESVEDEHINLLEADVTPEHKAMLLHNAGQCILLQRDFPRALRYFETAINIAPHVLLPYVGLALTYVRIRGKDERASEVLHAGLEVADALPQRQLKRTAANWRLLAMLAWVEQLQRNLKNALAMDEFLAEADLEKLGAATEAFVYLARGYGAALRHDKTRATECLQAAMMTNTNGISGREAAEIMVHLREQ